MALHGTLKKTKDWFQRIHAFPVWFAVVVGFVSGAVVALSVAASTGLATALLGLIGVALGGTISAVTSWLLARETQKAQIATTTLPERVKAHQEGFTLWREVVRSVHSNNDGERGEVIAKAQRWWEQNCLHLHDDVRDPFFHMILAANDHKMLLEGGMRAGARVGAIGSTGAIKDNWRDIMAVGRLLIEGAGGHITDDILRSLTNPNPGAGQPPSQS